MSSWRPLVAGTVGLFLIVLAFLAGQLKGGGDPGLRQNAAAATAQPTPQQDFGAGAGNGTDPTVPYGTDPYGNAPDGSGSVPDGSTPDLAPPTTHQS
jgi:hypothetical protein